MDFKVLYPSSLFTVKSQYSLYRRYRCLYRNSSYTLGLQDFEGINEFLNLSLENDINENEV